MKTIRLENFRCFRSKQTVPLAPLTLLVGENSTGKTSFMAAIHAMNRIMMGSSLSSSWGSPFNFGNFNQIAFGEKSDYKESKIDMGFDLELPDRNDLQCDFVIGSVDSSPVPVSARIKFGDTWATIQSDTKEEDINSLIIEIQKGNQRIDFPFVVSNIWEFRLLNLVSLVLTALLDGEPQLVVNMTEISSEGRESLQRFQETIESLESFFSFAGAPTRSKPQRTYDLIPSTQDPEGTHIMVYLAELSRNNKEAWIPIQRHLQSFGKSAGLFDEIIIRNFGGGQNDPFQVHVREYKKDGSGEFKNLIDVGYGVNQIIPIVADLYRLAHANVFLLQQPEVHLHPSAQAAMGSFFCNFPSWRQQLIVETHSDHLIDRVRMDIRDGKGKLTSEDVLLLFFERDGPEVKIHPIRFDEDGNVTGAPDTYRQFFMEETNRSIGW